MSDFDKEAERERLREKYEAEEADREATQHMSELLLKGATMTNSHCGTCGDPIFRYDGQEFCPTCQTQTASSGEDATSNPDAARQQGDATTAPDDGRQQGDATRQDADATTANAQPTTPERGADRGRSQQPADVRANETERSTADQHTAGTPATDPTDQHTAGTPATDPADQHTGAAPATESATDQPTTATGGPGAPAGSVDADAVANVEATVERFAAAAANTDDPERAREYLATVRDATDTLRALRGDAC
jgi:uncharacterized Zn finger protein (UPF0148 family)